MNIQELLKTNVNDHTEKKNNLTYLSWAWAWAEALKADSLATFKVEMFGDKCYMDINGTAMVWVTVTMFGKPMTCQLPVMDSSNDSIPFAGKTVVNKYGKERRIEFDSFAVNTTIMRCMTKALSLHGLGLYIYAGEDLPSDDGNAASKPVSRISPTQGSWESIPPNRQAVLQDVIDAIGERFAAADVHGVYENFIGITDGDEKVALWSKLDSKVRSAIKKQAEISKETK
jgi:hypothetical protein